MTISAIYTIGHSTRSIEELINLLNANEIKLLVDIRTVPRSSRNPQFNKDELKRKLPLLGIQYEWMADLGGFRHAKPDSVNTGWKNASFRGFADYMQTTEFEKALQDLIEKGDKMRTAIMCAEAVPWRCHRSLIADALSIRGITVNEILGRGAPRVHVLNTMARIDGFRVIYPADKTVQD